MGRHGGRDLVEDGGDLDHLVMVSAMDGRDLVRVGNNLPDIFIEICVVGVDDVVRQERQLPCGIILAARRRPTLQGAKFPCDRGKIDSFSPAGRRKGDVAAATEVYLVVFEHLGGPVVAGDDRANGFVRNVNVKGLSCLWFFPYLLRACHGPAGFRIGAYTETKPLKGCLAFGASSRHLESPRHSPFTTNLYAWRPGGSASAIW